MMPNGNSPSNLWSEGYWSGLVVVIAGASLDRRGRDGLEQHDDDEDGFHFDLLLTAS